MGKSIDLKKLQCTARCIRYQMLIGGDSLTMGKRRRKPRSPEKYELLKKMFDDRLEKFPPRREGNLIVLPYFENIV